MLFTIMNDHKVVFFIRSLRMSVDGFRGTMCCPSCMGQGNMWQLTVFIQAQIVFRSQHYCLTMITWFNVKNIITMYYNMSILLYIINVSNLLFCFHFFNLPSGVSTDFITSYRSLTLPVVFTIQDDFPSAVSTQIPIFNYKK